MTSFILNSEGWLLGLFTFAMLMHPIRVMLLAQLAVTGSLYISHSYFVPLSCSLFLSL